jgi:TusA-related sulfurtransferase
MEKELDLRGFYCPVPIIKTKIEIDKACEGDLITIIADDPAAEEDLKRWATRVGQEVVKITRSGRDVFVTIKKTKQSL